MRRIDNQKVEQISDLSTEFFNSLIESLDSSLMHRDGKKYNFKDIAGERMDLIISFVADDIQKTFEFIYGSQSSQPPKEIMDFVKKAFTLGKEAQEIYNQEKT